MFANERAQQLRGGLAPRVGGRACPSRFASQMTSDAASASSADKLALEVVSLLGERVSITLAPCSTLAGLRSKLAATPPFAGLCNLNLVHRGRQLDAVASAASLIDEGIADGDVIHAFFSTSASMSTSRSFAAPLEGSRCSSSGCGAAPRYVLRSRFDALEGRVEALELRLERALRTSARSRTSWWPRGSAAAPCSARRAAGSPKGRGRRSATETGSVNSTSVILNFSCASSRGRVPHATRTDSPVPGAG